MSLFEKIHRHLKTVAMPLGMVAGATLCRPISALDRATGGMITPSLIFAMLFVTFCRVQVRDMRYSPLHGWMLFVQLAGCLVVWGALLLIDPVIAQGGMICVLAPIAMAAVVIGGMLGANVATMATYSLICNFAIALFAPAVLTLTGNGGCTFWEILARISPLLILPFAVAQGCRAFLPGVARWVGNHGQISFYMWLASLTVIIGRTTAFILDLHDADWRVEIGLAVVAFVLCVAQFAAGRMLGRRYGDATAGGQSLGQKNTVLAVWMAQSFLDPISSIAPTAYIVWQNFVNSFQLWRHENKGSDAE